MKDYLTYLIIGNGVYDIICGIILCLGCETPQTFIFEEKIEYNGKLILSLCQFIVGSIRLSILFPDTLFIIVGSYVFEMIYLICYSYFYKVDHIKLSITEFACILLILLLLY
jgi:hypothetical protein